MQVWLAAGSKQAVCTKCCLSVCPSVAYGLSSLCTLIQSPRNRPASLSTSLDPLKPEMPKIDEVSEPEKNTSTSTTTIITSPTTPVPSTPSSVMETGTPSDVASTTPDGTESIDSAHEVSSALSKLLQFFVGDLLSSKMQNVWDLRALPKGVNIWRRCWVLLSSV